MWCRSALLPAALVHGKMAIADGPSAAAGMLVRAPVPWRCCLRQACRRSPHDTAAPSASYLIPPRLQAPIAGNRSSEREHGRAPSCSALLYIVSPLFRSCA
uniref:Secreted protein n=1 Tax=Arundo donax TaxID=35708 RepID=A0A0A9H2D7_ARUDO